MPERKRARTSASQSSSRVFKNLPILDLNQAIYCLNKSRRNREQRPLSGKQEQIEVPGYRPLPDEGAAALQPNEEHDLLMLLSLSMCICELVKAVIMLYPAHVS